MKKIIAVIAVFMAANVASAGYHPYISLYTGALSGNDHLKPSAVGSAKIGLQTDGILGVSLGALGYRRDAKVNILTRGGLSMIPVMFDGTLTVPFTLPILGNRGNLKVSGGVNYTFTRHAIDQDIVDQFERIGLLVQETVSGGIGTQVGGGVEFYIDQAEKISVGMEVLYLMFNPNAKTTVQEHFGLLRKFVTENELDFDSIIGLVTMTYRF